MCAPQGRHTETQTQKKTYTHTHPSNILHTLDYFGFIHLVDLADSLFPTLAPIIILKQIAWQVGGQVLL